MNQYRKIKYPKCPYCKHIEDNCWNNNSRMLVGLATGSGTSDVILKCENCGEKYRATVIITFYGKKMEKQNEQRNPQD